MGATTTAFNKLLARLKDDFPALQFVIGSEYRWSPLEATVYFNATEPESAPLLLHEIAHTLLSHDSYSRDITLLQLEREAWEKADELSGRYGIDIPEKVREDALDTYRDWLHARSTCPSCQKNGIQTNNATYQCLVCGTAWTVNEAKTCSLRRTQMTK